MEGEDRRETEARGEKERGEGSREIVLSTSLPKA